MNINYTYDVLQYHIKKLKNKYPFLKVKSAGKSVLGRNLTYIKLGNGPYKVFINGAHHSLEWITSLLLMKFIETFLRAYAQNTLISDYNPNEIWNKTSLYIMPMVNPDGVELVLNGLTTDNPYYENLIKWNNGNKNFSKVWQANIRGVDLNHNYDAAWELSKESEKCYGIFGPGPTKYSGKYAESEPESKAVADLTRKLEFDLVIAYHSQGEVIFWDFMDMASKETKKIAEILSKASGYSLENTFGMTSYAGYKDWFIKNFNKPGFTVEVGFGINPLPLSQFKKIYKDNEPLILAATTIGW